MTVYLVGAGPGDPGLITVRGAEVLGRADVVVYDRLSAAALLDLAPPGADRISVGKTPRGPSTPQEEINALLIDHGRAGKCVVRLKGGDPFVFARGGEEALALAAAGVPFEIVPGVSSAIAAAAYAGVPVTHRGLSTSFTVVTGHEDPWAATETDWDAVARVGGTIVVLMGSATRGEIAKRLIEGGLDPQTPVTAVQWASTPEQHTVRTTLDGLDSADVQQPATIVVGVVAELDLSWFEQRPLFGTRVLVPRAAHQAGQLSRRLHDLGAAVVETPVIRVEPGDAIPDVSAYEWIAFTSSNAVAAVFASIHDARSFGRAHVAAAGPATAQALRACGIVPDLVSESGGAQSLLDCFATGSGGGKVLLPQSSIARPALADGLRAKGWEVEVVSAYRTEPNRDAGAWDVTADLVAFTSSSTVDAFVELFGRERVPPTIVAMGEQTASSVETHGLTVAATASASTLDGLIDAILNAGNRTG